MSSGDNKQLDTLFSRLNEVENALFGENGAERVQRALLQQSIYSAKLVKVPSHYYELSLQDRASLLQVSSSQLCKSIIFENTACDHYRIDDPTNSRYYCVIVQYEGKSILSFLL
jgi:hypothetical protein